MPGIGTHFSRSIVFLLCQAVITSGAAAQTGSVARVFKDGQARIVWDSGTPLPGAASLGVVVERNRLIAIFQVQSSERQSSTVQIVDVLLPGLVSKNQKVRLLDLEASPKPPGQASFVVWSDREGGAFRVDGRPAGQVPARVILEPGLHEVLLDLPEGGKAGVKIEARAGEEEFVCIHGRSWPSSEREEGLPLFLPLASAFRKKPGMPPSLWWLEDSQGTRVYDCNEPVKNPTLKKKVIPQYPESVRRVGKEGKVFLEALIGSEGRVQQIDVLNSPDPLLTRAATEAALQWIYEPATLDGKPVPVFFTIMVDFYLTR